MRGTVKEKVTVSIDPDLVNVVDREVRAHHSGSRSAVVEEALRLWQVERQRCTIERETEAYYRALSSKDRREDRTWVSLSGQYAKRFWDE
jgi:Arc/MetJ-type ribon-helix-helix transcriptional regulator